MGKAATILFIITVGYTAWCAAYGPPYRDAYGLIVHAAWQMATK